MGMMIWVCFSGDKGTGGLYLDKNVNMNAVLYMNVLESYVSIF